MAQKPCYGYAVFCGVIFFRQTGQDSVQLGIVRVADECAFEYTILKRTITLNGNMIPAAVIQHVCVTGNTVTVCGVQICGSIQQKGVCQRKLQLVDFQRLFDTCFQKLDLAGGVVADTEMKDFALGFQLVKGFCHFFRFHEQIGAMEKQIIQTVCLQAAQTGFYAADDMFFGKVVAGEWAGTDAAFALKNEFITYGRLHLEAVYSGGNVPYPYDDLLNFGAFSEPTAITAEVLNTESVSDLICFLLCRYLEANLRFHACKFCGKLFGVTKNYKQEYCSRVIPGSEKTCKEMGSVRLYEKKIFSEPAIKEYKRSYKAHNARIRYGLMTREEFDKWAAEAREKRDACVAGKLSLEDFVAWLDSDKQR